MTNEQKEQILNEIRQIIAGTDFENHVFMVGGAVRDELMGLPLKDLDICVDLPDGGIQLALMIAHQQQTYRRKVHPQLFQAYGIARFHLASFPEIEMECVQTRRERYENRDSRNPVTEFAPIQDDCFRRDLTINALYKNLSSGAIVDLTGHGLEDMRHHIIRTPRDPYLTFDEDGLRLLRVIRFASRFGWEIEPGTLQGLKNCAQRITTISQDRITDEIGRMLSGPHPDYALNLLKDTGLMTYVLPEWMPQINQPYGTADYWDYLLRTVRDTAAVLETRWAAFLQPFSTEKAQSVLRRLNYSSDIQKNILELHRHLCDLDACSATGEEVTDKELRRLQYQWGNRAETVMNLLESKLKNQTDAKPELMAHLAARCQVMQQDGTACFQLRLPVNGKDIMEALQLKPGPQIREFMNRALELCLEHPLISKEDLLELLRQKA